MLLLCYQIIILLSLLVFAGILFSNLAELSRLPPVPDRYGDLPFVSVLVPARNEEHSIEACVLSLLQQHYPGFEVIVLDDSSEDRTGEILLSLQQVSGKRFRLVRGQPLPEGWHGKAWACRQLADAAAGELLLFTDADTRHKPDTLFRSVAAMQQSGVDMLTLTPYQEMEGFWEKLVIPLVYFILMSYLPLRMVRISPGTAFCSAIGQFMLFRRDIYRRIGGHGAVRDAIVEDVWLCRAVKKAGGRVSVFNGVDALNCRMYRTPGEIIRGFSKNLFAGLGYNTAGLFALIILTVAFHVLPWGFLAFSLFSGNSGLALFQLPLLQILLAMLCRVIIAVWFRQQPVFALLHAFSQLVLVGIALNSFAIVRFGKGPEWKGRSYNFGRAETGGRSREPGAG
jgi:chlorobactene glucosyltransferase